MRPISTLLTVLVLASIFAMAATATSTSVSSNQTVSKPDAVIKTTLQPDLSLKSALSPELLPQAAQSDPIKNHRSCRCGCGGTCNTDADCGPGGVCEPFISCCDKTGQIQWMEGGESSSRQGEMSILSIRCK